MPELERWTTGEGVHSCLSSELDSILRQLLAPSPCAGGIHAATSDKTRMVSSRSMHFGWSASVSVMRRPLR